MLFARGLPLFDRPYVLVVAATAFWGGNVVAGKLSVGAISPFLVTFCRWALLAVAMAPFFPGAFDRVALLSRGDILRLLAMSFTGFTGFNILYYIAAHHTSGVNIAILQGSMPIAVFILSILMGERIFAAQIAGAAMAITGIVVLGTRGAPERIFTLQFNHGDMLLFAASGLYALFTVLIRNRPALPPLLFFYVMTAMAAFTALPFYIYEIAMDQTVFQPQSGLVILSYLALFTSLLGQVFYVRAAEVLGAARVSVFYNLIPVFGALFSVLFLGEDFRLFHFVSLMMVVLGIVISERFRAAVPAAVSLRS